MHASRLYVHDRDGRGKKVYTSTTGMEGALPPRPSRAVPQEPYLPDLLVLLLAVAYLPDLLVLLLAVDSTHPPGNSTHPDNHEKWRLRDSNHFLRSGTNGYAEDLGHTRATQARNQKIV